MQASLLYPLFSFPSALEFALIFACVKCGCIYNLIACICRVFASMSCFVERLCLKQDMFLLVEVSIHGHDSHLSLR